MTSFSSSRSDQKKEPYGKKFHDRYGTILYRRRFAFLSTRVWEIHGWSTVWLNVYVACRATLGHVGPITFYQTQARWSREFFGAREAENTLGYGHFLKGLLKH